MISSTAVLVFCCAESVRVQQAPARHNRHVKKGVYVVPKRNGALAWENAEKRTGESSLKDDYTLRILAHKVDDMTNAVYLREVRKWLRAMRTHGVKMGSRRAVDKALAGEPDYQLYSGMKGVGAGQLLYWGVRHIWSDLNIKLPYARRAPSTWEGYEQVNGNVPAKKSTLTLVFDRMARAGAPEVAFLGHLGVDCYLRGMDWDGLLGEDVFVTVDREGKCEATLKFGRKHCGERSKTGSAEQGVKVGAQWISKVLYILKKHVKGEEKFFACTATDFRHWWWNPGTTRTSRPSRRPGPQFRRT